MAHFRTLVFDVASKSRCLSQLRSLLPEHSAPSLKTVFALPGGRQRGRQTGGSRQNGVLDGTSNKSPAFFGQITYTYKKYSTHKNKVNFNTAYVQCTLYTLISADQPLKYRIIEA